jgi:ribosome assembly protein YihI (activator of Der GTPase)
MSSPTQSHPTPNHPRIPTSQYLRLQDPPRIPSADIDFLTYVEILKQLLDRFEYEGHELWMDLEWADEQLDDVNADADVVDVDDDDNDAVGDFHFLEISEIKVSI